MPALNLGYLLRAGSTALTGARQGAREREETDAARMFNEWAKRNQMEFQNRQLDEQSRLRQATIDNTKAYNDGRLADQGRDDATRRWVEEQINNRFKNTGATALDKDGNVIVYGKNQIGPTGIQSNIPESQDGIYPNRGPRPPAPRRMPVGEVEKVTGVEGLLEIAQSAKSKLEALQKTKTNVTGPGIGRLAWLQEAVGAASPEVVGLRASLANIGSEEMLRRSGAAVTPSEFERLRPFIPSKNDPEEVLATKLDGFMREVRIIQEHRLNGLDDFDYDTSKFRNRRGDPSALPGAAPVKKYKENPY